jgi:hypothetical protein
VVSLSQESHALQSWECQNVRLLNPQLGLDQTIQLPEDQYILDIAEESGIRFVLYSRIKSKTYTNLPFISSLDLQAF